MKQTIEKLKEQVVAEFSNINLKNVTTLPSTMEGWIRCEYIVDDVKLEFSVLKAEYGNIFSFLRARYDGQEFSLNIILEQEVRDKLVDGVVRIEHEAQKKLLTSKIAELQEKLNKII